jgi:hypothetical protein
MSLDLPPLPGDRQLDLQAVLKQLLDEHFGISRPRQFGRPVPLYIDTGVREDPERLFIDATLSFVRAWFPKLALAYLSFWHETSDGNSDWLPADWLPHATTPMNRRPKTPGRPMLRSDRPGLGPRPKDGMGTTPPTPRSTIPKRSGTKPLTQTLLYACGEEPVAGLAGDLSLAAQPRASRTCHLSYACSQQFELLRADMAKFRQFQVASAVYAA